MARSLPASLCAIFSMTLVACSGSVSGPCEGATCRTEEQKNPWASSRDPGASSEDAPDAQDAPSDCASESPSGTRGLTYTDGDCAVWTLDDNHGVLRNGVGFKGGWGDLFVYLNRVGYHRGVATREWYSWDGTTWVSHGRADPGVVEQHVPLSDGVREVITTGSIASGSDRLTVASAAGLNVGDWVIVEIGAEAGRGQRGTRGVGGTWPSMSAPSEADVFASDPGQGGSMWAEDTGYTFFHWDGTWYSNARERENHWYTGSYFLAKAVPRSLQARITAIADDVLTLDRQASAGADNATVYFDNAPLISDLIAQQGSVTLPAGNFPIGGVVWIRDQSGVTLAGQGKDATRLYVPHGVPGGIDAHNAPNTVIENLTLEGNWGDTGYSLNHDSSTPASELAPFTDYIGGLIYPNGIMLDRGSNDSEVRDVRVINVPQNAVGTSFTSNVWARRIENIQTNVPRDYIQWQYKWGDAYGGGCEDCSLRSTYLLSGWETFKSTGVSFIRPKGTNGVMAANGSGSFLFDSPELELTANALHPESDPIAASVFEPMININTNIGVTQFVAEGGVIRNARMIQHGRINAAGDNLGGITINTNNANMRIEGGYFEAPDHQPGGLTRGTVAINSTATPNPPVIQDFVAVGRSGNAGAEQYNLYNLFGDMTNCVAWSCYPEGNCQPPN